MPQILVSTKSDKKYMVKTPSGRWVHFGQKNYSHYFDSALGVYSHLNHLDNIRRKHYLARAKRIKDKHNKLTWNNPESANYYAIKYLWS